MVPFRITILTMAEVAKIVKKTLYVLVVTLVITGLMIVSAASIPAQNKGFNKIFEISKQNQAIEITDVVVTVGVVNSILHFNATSNSDKTYVRYNINGSEAMYYTYVDPDNINQDDRNAWLGDSSTERWMIIRGLEPETTYNYTIRLDKGEGYSDDASGLFTTLPRFTKETGWCDEFFDDYLWDANYSISIYQSIGKKYITYVNGGALENIAGHPSVRYEKGKWHAWVKTGSYDCYYTNTTDPLEFSDWIQIETGNDYCSAHSVNYDPDFNKYIILSCPGGSGGRALGTSSNKTWFTPVNNRYRKGNQGPGVVVTREALSSYAYDGGDNTYDPLGANRFIYFVNKHLNPEGGDRVIAEGVVLTNNFNCTLAWEGYKDIREKYRVITGTTHQTYGMAAKVRNGIYIGILNILESGTNYGPMEVFLIYSRNGLNWNFVDAFTPLIPVGYDGAWDDGMTWAANEGIQHSTTDEDWLYYKGRDEEHGVGGGNMNFGRIAFRRYGLTYVKPDVSNGWLETTSIPGNFRYNFTVNGKFSSSAKLNILVLNATTGNVYSGFDLSDSDTITVDSMSIKPTWGNGARILSDIPSGDFKIIFKWDGMEGGELYSYNLSSVEDPDAPFAPEIDGPNSGTVRRKYEYTFKSISPVSKDVYYFIDWGDNTVKDWFGPYGSGEDVKVKHRWILKGSYTIKARAKDTTGLVGPEGTLSVTIPRSKTTYNSLFLWFLERFPILQKILCCIL